MSSLARQIGPALLVFGLVHAWLWFLAHTTGLDPFDPADFVRWDSNHYLDIARSGYALVHCTAAEHRPASDWCGDAGWFPGYPLIVAGPGRQGLPLVPVAVAVAALFHVATLVLIWTRFLGGLPPIRQWLLLVAVALSCGAVYAHAVFPTSAVLFFIVLTIDRVSADRWGQAAVAGLAAGFIYPTAVVLAGALGCWGVLRQRPAAMLPAFGVIAGGVAALAVIGAQTGSWDAYFLVQGKYAHHLADPIATLGHVLRPHRWLPPYGAPGLQSALALLVVAGALASGWRGRHEPVARLLTLYVAGAWLLPLCLGPTLAFARAETLLLPGVLLFRGVPVWLLILLVVVSAFVFQATAIAFFLGIIV